MHQGYQRTCFLLLLLALLWGSSACGSTDEYSEGNSSAENNSAASNNAGSDNNTGGDSGPDEQIKPDAGRADETDDGSGSNNANVEDEEDLPPDLDAKGSGDDFDFELEGIPDCPPGWEDEDWGHHQDEPDLPDEPEGSCRSSADCTGDLAGAQCYRPGQSIGCGACMERIDECAQDVDCGDGTVCKLVSGAEQCLCSSAMLCVPACTPDSCGEGMACKDNGRCGPIDCLDDSSCPDYFACTEAGECRRKACEDDAVCDGGYCVERGCYGNLGFCSWPPP